MSGLVHKVIRTAAGDDSWEYPERKLSEELKRKSGKVTFQPSFGKKVDKGGSTLYTLKVSYYPVTYTGSRGSNAGKGKSKSQSAPVLWFEKEGRDKIALAKQAVREWPSRVPEEHLGE